MKLEDIEDFESPKPPVSQQHWQIPEAKPVKPRRSLISVIVVICVAISGIAVIGGLAMTIDRPRTELAAPVAKAESKIDTPVHEVKAVESPKVEPPKAEPQKTELPKAEPKVVEAKPVVVPLPKQETSEELDKRIREQVIADREAKKQKIVIEELDEKPPIKQIYTRINDAEEASVKTGKPLLKWTGGSRDKIDGDLFRKLDGDFTHFASSEGETKVEFKDAAGLVYYIRPPFTERTPNVIKAKYGLVDHKDKFPQIDYPLNYRNRNLPDGGGCCVWASVSTLAYVHGYDFRLENNRRGGSTPYHAVQVLKKNGIPAQWTDMSRKKNAQYLRDACDAGLGCTVGVCLGYQGPMPMLHEINLAGINDTHAAILDNNDRQLKVRTIPIDKFLAMWDGSSVVIFPKGKEDSLAKYGKAGRYGQVNPNRPRDLSDEGPAARPGPTDDIGSFDPTGCYGNASAILDAWKSAGYTDDELKAKSKDYRDYRQ